MDNSIDDFAEKNWPSLKKDLKKTVGDTAYNNWIKYLAYISLENNIITFSVPTKFLRDWIVNNYSEKIINESKNTIIKLI